MELTMEQIASFDAEALKPIRTKEVFLLSELEQLQPSLSYDRRDKVEADQSRLQPLPVVAITNPSRDRLLVLKKNEASLSKQSPEKDALLVYAGGHIRSAPECSIMRTVGQRSGPAAP